MQFFSEESSLWLQEQCQLQQILKLKNVWLVNPSHHHQRLFINIPHHELLPIMNQHYAPLIEQLLYANTLTIIPKPLSPYNQHNQVLINNYS